MNQPRAALFLLAVGTAAAGAAVPHLQARQANQSSGQASGQQAAPPPHEPTAAEISKNETVSSALLRGLHYQEYEVRSAAEGMPEEKYAYRPAAGKFQNDKPDSALRKFVLSLSRSNTWPARILPLPPSSTARSRPTPAIRVVARALRKPRKSCSFICVTRLRRFGNR